MINVIRRALGLRSPSLDALSGNGPRVDLVAFYGAQRWHDMGLSDAPATVRARQRRRRKRARAQAAAAAPLAEALLGWLR